jgi:hypothetical protein
MSLDSASRDFPPEFLSNKLKDLRSPQVAKCNSRPHDRQLFLDHTLYSREFVVLALPLCRSKARSLIQPNFPVAFRLELFDSLPCSVRPYFQAEIEVRCLPDGRQDKRPTYWEFLCVGFAEVHQQKRSQ